MGNKKIIIGAVATLVILGLMAFKMSSSGFKYSWINSAKVYGEFKLKKQLEQKLNGVQLIRKNILDSLELDLKFKYQSLNSKDFNSINEFNTKREQFIEMKKQFGEDNEVLEQQYNEQILDQLNQYLTDYSKTKGIEMLFGADGKGTLIYAADGNNVTDEVIIYVNNKFEGVIK